MDTTKTTTYMIIPSTYSGITSVVSVVILFILYNVYIGYIASYNLKFYPNMYMLWHFVTSSNNKTYQKEFEEYVRMVVLENKANMVEEPFTTIRMEDPIQSTLVVPQPSESSSSWMDNVGKTVHMWWNRVMLASFVQGKRVKVHRSLDQM